MIEFRALRSLTMIARELRFVGLRCRVLPSVSCDHVRVLARIGTVQRARIPSDGDFGGAAALAHWSAGRDRGERGGGEECFQVLIETHEGLPAVGVASRAARSIRGERKP